MDGSVLRERREQLGLTLRAVSEKAGVAISTLSDIERNRRRPSVGMLEKLAPIIGVSPGELVDAMLRVPTDSDLTETDRTQQSPSGDSQSREEAVS